MIVLDTNVISEIWRATPSSKVIAWLRAQPDAALFVTTITEAEIFYGVALLSNGRGRRALEMVAQQMFADTFAGRILPFDSAAAREYAVVAASRRRSGRPIAEADAQIAAISRSRDALLATRNLDDFAGCTIELVDPWTA